MADMFDKKTRSRIMSRIKSTTMLEKSFRKALWAAGLRGYRVNSKLPGKPDIVFPKARLAVFVDGDFWHGYNWKVLGKVPPRKYWQKKISGNMKRDVENSAKLKRMSWKVLRFWEHSLRKNPVLAVKKIMEALRLSNEA